jgi:predicted acylesterase/phospholipase RssA
MTEPKFRTLRNPWPFRRVAVVLSGGGAFGAYEVGVLRVLEKLGLRPSIVAGVSVGAINAVVWLAHGFRTVPLERAWLRLRGSTIGIRWFTIALRALSLFIVMLAALELVLAIAGAPELGVRSRFRRLEDMWGFEVYSILAECLTWILLGAVGVLLGHVAGRVEDTLAHFGTPRDPGRPRRWLQRGLIVGAGVYVVAAIVGPPWPWRVHALLLIAGLLIWLGNRAGGTRAWMRRLFLDLMPETRGRGLWRALARRRLLQRLVAAGDPSRLLLPETHLIVSACAIDNGRMSYFVNWPDPSATFRERARDALGEVVEVLRAEDVIEAAVASSSVPVLFAPLRYRGHDYLDAGVFSNQPIRVVVADGADAVLTVLVSPSGGPRPQDADANVLDLVARLQELANWRDLQTELRLLPSEWSRDGDPARLCVIEPEAALPGALFDFDPKKAAELMRIGERDALRALDHAGWLAPPDDVNASRPC